MMDANFVRRYAHPMGANAKLYDRDFYAWTREQAELLRAGRFAEADLDNIVEEIESMGKRERRELVSRIGALLLHLLRWRHQPGFRGVSWRLLVKEQRLGVAAFLAESPSLQPSLPDAVVRAWPLVRLRAERETGLDASAFPAQCPWTASQALDDAFWPE